MSRVSIIVPVRDGGERFCACLKAVAARSPAPGELIVVMDGSGEEDAEAAARFGARVFHTSTAHGPAAARNLGAKHAVGQILLFLDADVLPAPDVVEKVDEAFETRPEMAALFGSYDDAPGEANLLSQYKNLFHHYVHQMGREDAFTFWSGCGAIRRAIFLAMGGFDQKIYTRPAIEDIELGYRLRRAGHAICLRKDIQVKHLKRWTALSLLKTDYALRAVPWTRLILRDGTLPNDLNLSTANRLSAAMAGLMMMAVCMGAAYWPALLAVPILVIGLLVANARLYRFFAAKRGVGFALVAIPWHWVYYLCGGTAFAIVTAIHLLCGSANGDEPPTPIFDGNRTAVGTKAV